MQDRSAIAWGADLRMPRVVCASVASARSEHLCRTLQPECNATAGVLQDGNCIIEGTVYWLFTKRHAACRPHSFGSRFSAVRLPNMTSPERSHELAEPVVHLSKCTTW